MGLFDKLKGKKETVDWSNAYTATPSVLVKGLSLSELESLRG